MTTLDLPADASAVLVYAVRPPDLADERFVDVRPGLGGAFDGSRYRIPIHVTGPARRRRTYDNHEPVEIVSSAAAHLMENDVVFLRLGNRARLRDIWSARTVEVIERRLVATVRREGATLVTWTDADRRSTGGVDYDAVVTR